MGYKCKSTMLDVYSFKLVRFLDNYIVEVKWCRINVIL